MGPGQGAAFLNGERIRSLIPLLQGDELRLGESILRLGEPQESPVEERSSFGDMVAVSPGMRRLFGELARVAEHDFPVLILGESGTGKELAARGLHQGAEGVFCHAAQAKSHPH